MNLIQRISPILLGMLLVFGCTDKFEDLNTNPNAPENVSPQFLLSNVLWEAANNNTRQGWLAGNFLAQHTANLEFLPVDRYDLGTNTEYWNLLYRLLNDTKTMEETAAGNDAFQGVGKIMRAWLASQLTDLWTDAPYSNALAGRTDGNFTPSYDTQETIYTGEGGILELLENAVSRLEATTDVLTGDIMYGGDLEKWVKFANSLRVRYLLRISNRVDVSANLQALVNGGKLLTGLQDQPVVPYLNSAPNQWFIFTEREGRYTDVRMSTTIDATLDGLNDPRVTVFFKPALPEAETLAGQYVGIPNGLSRESQNAYNLSQVSLLGARFRDVPNGLDAMFMQYSELQFSMAEAAEKGWIEGDANAFYQAGISASFAYYGLTPAETYLNSAEVRLTGTGNLEKILTQKWISLFMNGHEAWLNIRRTGIPVLPIPANNINGDNFPHRYLYPESEQAVNDLHYESAVSRIGGDTYNSKGWWDK